MNLKTIMDSGSRHFFTITELENGYLQFTDEMMKELEWEESDELKFDVTEVCEDYGEYKSLYIRNITAEERLKNESR